MGMILKWIKGIVKLTKRKKDLTDRLTMAGHMLDKIYKVDGNVVLDLELRGNRADCYSITGIAREVSALFETPVKYRKTNIKLKKVKKFNIYLDVEAEMVKRVMVVEISDIKLIKSPKWLKERIEEYGMESINNIVDLTNYVMIETGQPMHTFDLEKIDKNLEIRLASRGEQMITFLGKTVTLDKNDIVWAQGKEILSVAAAIGSKKHSITSATKSILLEGANYDRASIRRSIHKYKLLTEAGIRQEKELDPNIVDNGIKRFLELVQKNKWGSVTRNSCVVYDYYPKPKKSWKLILNYDYLDKLSGIFIDRNVVIKILRSLNFEIVRKDKTHLEVLVPTYRTDVTLQEDLIEEILRIYGYENIPVQTLSLEIPKVVTPQFINQELNIKNQMMSLGFDEVISSTCVGEDYLEKNKSVESQSFLPVKISNRPSQDFEFLRMSLFPNLYEFTQKILNERGTESYLFEVGKIYYKKQSEYTEKRKIGITYYQRDGEFVHFKGYLEAFFLKLDIENISFETDEAGFKIS